MKKFFSSPLFFFVSFPSPPLTSSYVFLSLSLILSFSLPHRRLTDAMTGFGYSYATLTSAAFWMRLAADLGLVTGELNAFWPSFK